MVFRIIKAIIAAVIAYSSAMYLFDDPRIALASAVVPFVLISLQIFSHLGNAITAILFASAVFWSVASTETKQDIIDIYSKNVAKAKG